MYIYIPSVWGFCPVQDLGRFMFHPQILPRCLHCAWPPCQDIKEIHTYKPLNSGEGADFRLRKDLKRWCVWSESGGYIGTLQKDDMCQNEDRAKSLPGWANMCGALDWAVMCRREVSELRPEREGQLDLDASWSSAEDTDLDLSDCEGVMTVHSHPFSQGWFWTYS